MTDHPADVLARAERFVWLTARVLEQRRFDYLFRSGSAVAVNDALGAYRNPDGGFGYALEPDGRGPVSQPLHTHFALRLLDELDMTRGDLARGDLTRGDVATRAYDYFASIATADGGIPAVLPSIRDYPHAPWWLIEEEPAGSLLMTALVAGLLHKNKVDHPWLAAATDFCWNALPSVVDTHPYEAIAAIAFLDQVPDRARAEREAERLGRIVRANRLVVLDAPGWEAARPPGYAPGEVHYPHDYAPEPESLARRWFSDDEIDRGLDALLREQGDDGGWPVRWGIWTPVTQFNWRPSLTIDALVTLRAYGRLPG